MKATSFVILTLWLNLASVCFATPPTPPQPPSPSDYYICPGRPQIPRPVRPPLPKTIWTQHCRPQMVWPEADRWLCNTGNETLILDFPADQVGKVVGVSPNENFVCRKLALPCDGELYLFEYKYCESEEEEENYWLSFAEMMNEEPKQVDEKCKDAESDSVTYLAKPMFRSECKSEFCIFTNLPKQLIYFKETTGSVQHKFLNASPKITKQLQKNGVYCVRTRTAQQKTSDADASLTEIRTVQFVAALPENWPITKLPTPGQTAPGPLDSFRCQSDRDCIKTGGGACMLALPGQRKTFEKAQKDSSYGCVCVKGPVFFGCVPKKKK